MTFAVEKFKLIMLLYSLLRSVLTEGLVKKVILSKTKQVSDTAIGVMNNVILSKTNYVHYLITGDPTSHNYSFVHGSILEHL